jgi:PKD repeat protein
MNPTVAVIAIVLLGGLLAVVGGVFTTNSPPKAGFIATPADGEVPLLVAFDATNSSDPDGDISSYQWDFGDGKSGTGIKSQHAYDTPANYKVKLTVTDNKGASDSTTQTIRANPAANESPKASFTATPTTGPSPLEVRFDAAASSDPDGAILDYKWDFGDGAIGSGKNESHIYEKEGIYSVRLTVTDDRGATDTLVQEIEISTPSDEETTTNTADNGFLKVTLRGIRSESRIGVWESDSRCLFAIVDLKAEAIRDEQNVRDLDFRIVDSENRVYYSSGATYSLKNPFADSLLARGEWTDGEIAFEVYPASHYMLKYDKRNQPPIEFRFSLE